MQVRKLDHGELRGGITHRRRAGDRRVRAVPYPTADRLVAVWNSSGQSNRMLSSWADFERWQQHRAILDNLGNFDDKRARDDWL